MEENAINDIELGPYKVDLFITENGSLGVTVTKDLGNSNAAFTDGFFRYDEKLGYMTGHIAGMPHGNKAGCTHVKT